jgi:hypothetical protein
LKNILLKKENTGQVLLSVHINFNMSAFRIKSDRLSGKDKARYLKSLKEQNRSADSFAAKSNLQPGGGVRASEIIPPIANKPSRNITTSQLTAKTPIGRSGNSTSMNSSNSQSTHENHYASNVTLVEYDDDDIQEKEETDDQGVGAVEPVDPPGGSGSQLPAGFFDDGIEDIVASHTQDMHTKDTSNATTSAKKDADDLDAFMNEIDNIPGGEAETAEAEEAQHEEEEEEAVQLAYQTKIARLLHKRAGASGSKNDVFDEMDSVLMNYTSSVPTSSALDDVSTAAAYPSSSISSDVQAALSRTKMKKRRHDEIVSSSKADFSPLDLLDWTAKQTR